MFFFKMFCCRIKYIGKEKKILIVKKICGKLDLGDCEISELKCFV